MNFDVFLEAFSPFARLLVVLMGVVFIGILMDYLTGTIAAKMHDEWSSVKAREGLTHKVGILLAILLGVVIDVAIIASKSALGWNFPYVGLFTPLITLAYIVTEIGSILENLKKMGVYVPPILVKGFAVLKQAVELHSHVDEVEDEDEEVIVVEDEPPDEV